MKEINIDIELLEGAENAPIYASLEAAGFDFQAREDIVVPKYDTKLIKTGVKVALPPGYAIFVCSRSGLALKAQVFVLNAPGVIDSDYRGEIGVILTNAGHEEFVIKAGDRIAQGVIVEAIRANWKVVQDISELRPTERGEGGFGHTGK